MWSFIVIAFARKISNFIWHFRWTNCIFESMIMRIKIRLALILALTQSILNPY